MLLPSQEFVYVRTYARWLEDDKRRETWPETVERVVTFLKEERPTVPDKVFKKISKYMLSMDVLPSMRLVWSAGEAAKKDNTCLFNCSFLVMNRIEAFSEALHILCCGTGVGFSVENKYVTQLPIIKNMDSSHEPETFLIPDTKEGWADSVKVLIQGLYNGTDILFDYSGIRKKGSRLKTMGGRASGPEPLIILHGFIREMFRGAQGRKLKDIEVHDIMNEIAQIVVSGGVRRSSEISLSDLNSEDMRKAKQGYNFPVRRYMANNSAVYYEKPSAVEFLKEWTELAASGTGERGIFNLGSVHSKKSPRRNYSMISGTNPCVPGSTEIFTKNGYKRIDSLVGQDTSVWNGFEWSTVTPRITGYDQPMVEVSLSDGRKLKCTEAHNWITVEGFGNKNKTRTKAIDLVPGTKLLKHDFPVIREGESVDPKFAYTQGFVSAEGSDNCNICYVYEPKYSSIPRLDGKFVPESHGNRGRLKLNNDHKLKSFVPFEWDLDSRLQWLAGLLDGDGTELKEGGSQLVSIDTKFLQDLQKLLSTLGVQSKILHADDERMRMMPDGRGGSKEFLCQKTERICIGAIQMQDLKNLGLNCERMSFEKYPNRDASQFVVVKSVEKIENEPIVYCYTEPKRNYGCFDGIVTGNCGEILLRDQEFCNLSSVVVKADDDLDTLFDKIETATWIGCIQSSFTTFPYLNSEWKKNCDEERLLGVSLSGQMDAPHLLTANNLEAMKKKSVKIAKHASKHLGINMPASITCVKPEGTSSQLTDSASGQHPRYSKFYVRRYRISGTDSLFRLMKDQGLVLTPENGQTEENATTWVASFPVKSPEGCITRHDMGAIQQLEWYKHLQANWCEHNASLTVYVKDNEWLEVGNWVYQNWDIINGVSFLPFDGGNYQQAPYEEIDEATYNKLLAEFKPIDYSQLSKFEQEDNTEGARTLACVGGVCEI